MWQRICKLFLLNILVLGWGQKSMAQATALSENFNACFTSFPAGWQQYSVTGTDVWECTASGYTGRAVFMSGYSSGSNNTNEDWLISPQLNFANYSMPMLSFWSRTKFAGSFIQLWVSNNYSGSGNPNTASWTQIPVTLPTANSDVWFFSNQINLTAYKSSPLHFAFKYISSTTAAANWRLDDIMVNEGALIIPKKFVNAGQCAANFQSDPGQFQFTMNNLSGTLELMAVSPFELSKDGNVFSNQISYNSSISGMTQTVYVRVSPSVSDKIFRKPISFIYNGISLNQTVDALGTSLPDGKTLRVVNWNMRWFGDPLNCNCDTTLSRQQATTILKDLQADIYCLQEIVSISQLNAVRQALGTQYQLFVSPFGSGATSSSSGNYPGAQKLAYLINTQKVIHAGDFGLTASQYPGDTSAYACFASGRYPYILKAALKQNSGPPDTLIVVNIHAKAGSTSSDYNRRVCASQWMADSLNALFPIQKKLIVGDFNDYLEGSSVAGQSTSPFQNLFTSGYVGVTLPSVYPGQTTFLGSADHLIDNVVFSQNMSGVFPDSACFIFSEAPRYISDYEATMSDHLPVMSYYKFNNPLFISENTSVSDIRMVNPSKGRLQLYFNQSTSDWSLKIYDLCGKLLNQSNHAPTSSRVEINLTDIQPGMYIVQVQTKSGIWQQKWLNLE